MLRVTSTAAHPEDLGSVISTHMAAHESLQLQFQGIRCPLLTSLGHHTLTWCMHTQEQTEQLYT